MLWPARPKPLPGETPASWFARVARANGHRSSELARVLQLQAQTIRPGDVEPQTGFSFRALDKGVAGIGLMGVLAKPTGVPVAVIEEILRVAARIEEFNNLMLATPDVVWRFCPRCLRDDPVPYLRLEWRKGWHLLCPAHLVWIEDRCKHCEAPVDLELHGPDSGSLAVCGTCGNSLGSHAGGHNGGLTSKRVGFLERQRRLDACLMPTRSALEVGHAL